MKNAKCSSSSNHGGSPYSPRSRCLYLNEKFRARTEITREIGVSKYSAPSTNAFKCHLKILPIATVQRRPIILRHVTTRPWGKPHQNAPASLFSLYLCPNQRSATLSLSHCLVFPCFFLSDLPWRNQRSHPPHLHWRGTQALWFTQGASPSSTVSCQSHDSSSPTPRKP